MPTARTATRIEQGEAVVAGVLSGTSGDGIDVALVRFGPLRPTPGRDLGAPEVLAFETLGFPPALAGRVRAALDGDPGELGSARAIALLSRDLGRAFGAAVDQVAMSRGLEVDLVGSHGLTVYHHDGAEPSGAATLQLGDGDFVAEACGAACVSDFRQRDVAAGGQGAPLSALCDPLLFRDAPRPVAILNLGGLANLTLLDSEVHAFDTGPAGSLLDGLARRLLDRPLDPDGEAAAHGHAHSWLTAVQHPFFDAPPPKSTGRDTFGEAYVEEFLQRAATIGVREPVDILASAVELVAATIAHALERFADPRPSGVLVAGGGAHNRTLMRAIAGALAPTPVASTAAVGVDPDAREALVFAVLAARAALGIPSSLPGATGAAPGRVLGKTSAAPFLA